MCKYTAAKSNSTLFYIRTDRISSLLPHSPPCLLRLQVLDLILFDPLPGTVLPAHSETCNASMFTAARQLILPELDEAYICQMTSRANRM